MKYKLSRYLLQKVSDTFGNLVSLKRFGTVPDCTASGSCRSRGCLKAKGQRKKIVQKNLKVVNTNDDHTLGATTSVDTVAEHAQKEDAKKEGAEHDAAAGEQAAAGNAANEQAAEADAAWEAVGNVFG